MKQYPSGYTDNGNKAQDWTALVVDILNTNEARRILADVSAAWLREWSGGSVIKKGAGRPAAWMLSKTLLDPDQNDLPSVFENPEHIQALFNKIPTFLENLTAIVHSALRTVERMPTERKKALLNQLACIDDIEKSDGFIKGLSHILEDIYSDDPHFFSKLMFPLIENGIARSDFGELKSLFDTAGADLENLLEQTAGVLFDYPAKLIALLSLAPDGINLITSTFRTVLEKLNALPPDILTDLFLGLFRRVDTATIGQIVNRINEAIRQLHTGSTLIGEMDAPQFTSDLREKISAVVSEIDPVLALKARSALIDGRETLLSVLIDTVQEHPDFLNLWLHQLALKRNVNLRLLKQKFDVFEMLPEQEADEALAVGLSRWNAYDLAEMVNALSRTINRLNRIKPDLFPDLVKEFVHSVDLYELEESVQWASRELGSAVRPIFRMAAPAVINALCDFFEPDEEDDGYDEAMLQAKQRLQHLLAGREVSK
jgi:hypothetical protein